MRSKAAQGCRAAAEPAATFVACFPTWHTFADLQLNLPWHPVRVPKHQAILSAQLHELRVWRLLPLLTALLLLPCSLQLAKQQPSGGAAACCMEQHDQCVHLVSGWQHGSGLHAWLRACNQSPHTAAMHQPVLSVTS
jgi:hypothetical protein